MPRKLQLIERNRFDPAMEALIENLELLARRDASALRRVCGVDDEDLADMIRELKALTPRLEDAFRGRAAGGHCPGCVRASGSFRRLAGRSQYRHPAESAY